MEEHTERQGVTSCPFSGRGATHTLADEPARHYVVVGDRIKTQCTDAIFISVATAQTLMADAGNSGQLTLHVGQGITDQQLTAIYERTVHSSATLNIIPVARPARASAATTHKLNVENIAISVPTEQGNGTYLASLMIDDANAELSDHLTGQHVSGMMIVEAARQMTIAVAEHFYVSPDARGKVNFVTHKMDVSYFDFVLPISTEILCIPLELKRSGTVNFRFNCQLQFKQQGRCLAELGFEVSVIDSRFFQLKETELLHRFVKQLV